MPLKSQFSAVEMKPPGCQNELELNAGSATVRLFFVTWTLIALFVTWWLWTSAAQHPSLLIAVDSPPSDTVLGMLRRWIAANVDVAWAWPWVLLAPYAFWLGLRISFERAGLPWRLGAHLAAVACFVVFSRTLAGRLEAGRPQAVYLMETDIVQRNGPEGSNETRTIEVRKHLQWPVNHSDPGARPAQTNTHSNEVIRRDQKSTGQPTPERGTPSAPTNGLGDILLVQAEVHTTRKGDVITTNSLITSTLTNFSPEMIASQLAPVIGQHLVKLRAHPPLPPVRRWSAALDLLAYVALAGLGQALQFRRRLGERERHAGWLEARLTRSHLAALQAQLQPHFLFNTLNGIALLVRREPRVAEEMLLSLSELLRISLAQSGRQEIPLREELVFLDRYLELQQMRFGDRLRVEREIEAEAQNCLVPPLLLQPLVENAIRHGIEPSPGSGLIRITACVSASKLTIAVENRTDMETPCEAARSEQETTAGHGIGLNNVRERLAGLYGPRHTFVSGPLPSGYSVRIELPVSQTTTPIADLPDETERPHRG